MGFLVCLLYSHVAAFSDRAQIARIAQIVQTVEMAILHVNNSLFPLNLLIPPTSPISLSTPHKAILKSFSEIVKSQVYGLWKINWTESPRDSAMLNSQLWTV